MTKDDLPTTRATYQSDRPIKDEELPLPKASKLLSCTMPFKHHNSRRVRIPIIS